MTPEEAVAELSKLTYRPGWRVHAYAVPGAVVFTVGSREPSVADPSVCIPVQFTQSISDTTLANTDLLFLLQWARDVIYKRALHEVDEWLLHDGKHVTAPHPGRTEGILGDGLTPT